MVSQVDCFFCCAMFANKVLLGHSPAHLLPYCLGLPLTHRETIQPVKLKTFTIWGFTGKVCPDLSTASVSDWKMAFSRMVLICHRPHGFRKEVCGAWAREAGGVGRSWTTKVLEPREEFCLHPNSGGKPRLYIYMTPPCQRDQVLINHLLN